MLRTVRVEPMELDERRVIIALLHSLEQVAGRDHVRDPIDEHASAITEQDHVGQGALLDTKLRVFEVAEAVDLAPGHARSQHHHQWVEPIAPARNQLAEAHPASAVLWLRSLVVGQLGSLCLRIPKRAGEQGIPGKQLATPVGQQGVRLLRRIAVIIQLALEPLDGECASDSLRDGLRYRDVEPVSFLAPL